MELLHVRYGLASRGGDPIERTMGSTVTSGFPVYSAHGNNVATLSRSGTGYAVNDRRSYGAWGAVRAQQSAGDPKLRYCASLGHRADDESGLVYMRARYYEPASGRFVSEDPSYDGHNWFSYCGNDPVNSIDGSGKTRWKEDWQGGFGRFCSMMAIGLAIGAVACGANGEKDAAVGLIVAAATFAAASLSGVDDFGPEGTKTLLTAFRIISSSAVLMGIARVLAIDSEAAKGTIAFGVAAAATAYTVMVLGALVGTMDDDQRP